MKKELNKYRLLGEGKYQNKKIMDIPIEYLNELLNNKRLLPCLRYVINAVIQSDEYKLK